MKHEETFEFSMTKSDCEYCLAYKCKIGHNKENTQNNDENKSITSNQKKDINH